MRTYIAIVCATLLVVVVAVSNADSAPPRFRQPQRQFFGSAFARQELDDATDPTSTGAPYPPAGNRPGREFPLPTETESPIDVTEGGNGDGDIDTDTDEETTAAGPYEPSGWKPAGQRLTLPTSQRQSRVQKQQKQQQQQWQPQQPNEYYGAPEATTTATFGSEFGAGASNTADTNETTDEPESEPVPNSAQLNSQQQQIAQQQKPQKLQRLQKSQKLQQQQLQQLQQLQQFQQFQQFQQLQQLQQQAAIVPGSFYVQLPLDNTAGLVSAQLQAAPATTVAVYPVQKPTAPLLTAAKLQQAAAQPHLPQFVYSQLVAAAPQQSVSYSSQYQSW